MNKIRSVTKSYQTIESQKPLKCPVCRDQDFSLSGMQYAGGDPLEISIRCNDCDCSDLPIQVSDFSYVTHTFVEDGRRVCVYTFYNCDLSSNHYSYFDDDDDGLGSYYFHAIRHEPCLAFSKREVEENSDKQ